MRCLSPRLSQVRERGVRPPAAWCAPFGGNTHACTDDAYAADGALGLRLAVTLNGRYADASIPVAWLYWTTDPELSYASPWGAPNSGGSLVEIIGVGLLSYGGVICFFSHPGGRDGVEVRAWREYTAPADTAPRGAHTRNPVLRPSPLPPIHTAPPALIPVSRCVRASTAAKTPTRWLARRT